MLNKTTHSLAVLCRSLSPITSVRLCAVSALSLFVGTPAVVMHYASSA